jgi:hypothetical protein
MRPRWITSVCSPRWLCGCAVVALATTGPLASAQDVVTQAAGGSGGDPYTIGCGTKALVGVQGRAIVENMFTNANAVGVIQSMCVDVNTDGTWIGTPAPAPGIAGVTPSGSTNVTLLCPHDRAVSGVSGRSGSYLDALMIWCTPIGEYGHLNGSPAQVANAAIGYGDLGDAAFGPFFCPDNKPGKGFTGRSHDWVDRIALLCNYPSVPPASVKSITVTASSIVGGHPVTGSVTLNATAPTNGTKVTLSVNDALGSFPINPISVSAGSKVGMFTFYTHGVPTPTIANIVASLNTGSASAQVTMQPPTLSAMSIPNPRGSPGGTMAGTVSLTGAAFAGGLAMELLSSDASSIAVPATVTVADGQSSASFSATAASHPGCSVISTTYNTLTQSVPLAVLSSATAAFSLRESSTLVSATVEVIFPTAAIATRALAVASSNPRFASVPTSIQIAAGAATATFSVAVQGSAAGPTCALISVTDGKGNANSFVIANANSRISIIPGT